MRFTIPTLLRRNGFGAVHPDLESRVLSADRALSAWHLKSLDGIRGHAANVVEDRGEVVGQGGHIDHGFIKDL